MSGSSSRRVVAPQESVHPITARPVKSGQIPYAISLPERDVSFPVVILWKLPQPLPILVHGGWLDVLHIIWIFSDYDCDWVIWISTDPDRPVIMSIVGADPYVQGWPQYRAYFSNWDFEPEVPDGVFTYITNKSVEQMTWPKLEERLNAQRDSLQQECQPDAGPEPGKTDN